LSRRNVVVLTGKSIDDYMALDYDLVITKVEFEGEHVYKACARELDSYVFYGLGDTKEEAIASFEDVRAELVPYYFENGIPIAEPVREDAEAPSGKFLVRTSPGTHKKLIEMAEKNGHSLNAYVNSILDSFTTAEAMLGMFAERLGDMFAPAKVRISAWKPDSSEFSPKRLGKSKDIGYDEAA
jgi:predicted HicB family RNase H-like nuclease